MTKSRMVRTPDNIIEKSKRIKKMTGLPMTTSMSIFGESFVVPKEVSIQNMPKSKKKKVILKFEKEFYI